MDIKNICNTSAAHYREYKDKRKQLIEEGVNDYSLIHSLLKASREVQLHSNFIFSFINPRGLHYQGDIFLRIFLSQLPNEWHNFIDVSRAVVIKERYHIDLIITDGFRYIIIENKIIADDQDYQITRYVQTVKKLADMDKSEIEERIAVVYLSTKKSKPSDDSKSLIGFDLLSKHDKQSLIWTGLSSEEKDEIRKGQYHSLIELDITAETKIRYYHYPYYPTFKKSKRGTLAGWVSQCIDALENKQGKDDLIYALREYEKILDRLRKPAHEWKNMMDLAKYMIELHKNHHTDHDDVYMLMIESQKALPKYVAARIYKLLKSTFENADIESGNGRFEKGITESFLVDWLTKKGGKKAYGIGFVYEGYEITFAKEWVYIKPEGNDYSIDRRLCEKKGSTRRLLLKDPEGLTFFEAEIGKKAKEIFGIAL